MIGQNADSQLFSKLTEAIGEMRFLTVSRAPTDHIPYDRVEVVCPLIQKETENLNGTAAGEIIQVDRAAMQKKWQQFCSDPSDFPLSLKDYKKLCWMPEIVVLESFQKEVIEKSFPVTLPALRGLLYSYHENYDNLKAARKFSTRLAEMIELKSVANSTVRKWHASIDFIIGSSASRDFAKETLGKFNVPQVALEELSVNLTTNFASSCASEYAKLAAASFGKLPESWVSILFSDVLSSNLLPNQILKYVISEIILSKTAENNDFIRGLIVDFLLTNENFGDPRMDGRWSGVSEEAKAKVVQWLSSEDIHFFFELIFRNREDKHGRKSFWLQYVKKVNRSRALISFEDRKRYSVKLKELEDKGRTYGKLTGNSTTSAFILDFGPIVVVEFNEVGNACYFYKKEEFSKVCSNFWASDISFGGLKDSKLKLDKVSHRQVVSEISVGWDTKVVKLLSDYGVRRG
ncbi:MAG: hypothetical protein IT292_04875 [Deltaproteobacteria bacterium]|nr:hypothetical protein [Deltaproteobacteria bacterium]